MTRVVEASRWGRLRPRLRRDGDAGWQVGFAVLAIAGLLLAGFGLLLHAIPTPVQLTIAITAFVHYLMWAAILALVIAAVARRWVLTAVSVVVTAVVLLVQVPAYVAATPPAGGHPLVVMQSNLKLGSADPATIVSLVRSQHVEVLATEELTEDEQARLIGAGLTKLLPYRFSTPGDGGSGLGMWSRYPLSNKEDLPDFRLGVLRAHVAVPDTDGITFLAVHLLPPYPYAPQVWRAEVPRLGRIIDATPSTLPTLAAGDYNSTTDHAQFRDLLEHGFADAGDQAGAGYPASYPTDRWFGPLIAIDHVLTRDAVGTELTTYDVPGSDHRSLVVHLSLGD